MSDIDKAELDREITREPENDDDAVCDSCGTPVSIGGGCIDCKPCNGEYEPGTEECDRCALAHECIAPRQFPG